jgi:hypothetical protein
MRQTRFVLPDFLLHSWLAVGLVVSLMLFSGCNGGSSNDRDSLPDVIGETGSGAPGPGDARASSAPDGGRPGQTNVVSKIEGDRLQVIPREIVLTKVLISYTFRE